MAGAKPKYRHLSRNSAHRRVLLRNLVTSLFTQESISTTWPKAKEAQRIAEKLVTLAKRNTEQARRRAQGIFFRPHTLLPKLFTEIRERYADRPGGYTRVLRIEPLKEDQAPSAILELVDGPRDMRFALTAQTIARDQALQREHTDITRENIKKVTRFRKDGAKDLGDMIDQFKKMEVEGQVGRRRVQQERVYKTRSEMYYGQYGMNRKAAALSKEGYGPRSATIPNVDH